MNEGEGMRERWEMMIEIEIGSDRERKTRRESDIERDTEREEICTAAWEIKAFR